MNALDPGKSLLYSYCITMVSSRKLAEAKCSSNVAHSAFVQGNIHINNQESQTYLYTYTYTHTNTYILYYAICSGSRAPKAWQTNRRQVWPVTYVQ